GQGGVLGPGRQPPAFGIKNEGTTYGRTSTPRHTHPIGGETTYAVLAYVTARRLDPAQCLRALGSARCRRAPDVGGRVLRGHHLARRARGCLLTCRSPPWGPPRGGRL